MKISKWEIFKIVYFLAIFVSFVVMVTTGIYYCYIKNKHNDDTTVFVLTDANYNTTCTKQGCSKELVGVFSVRGDVKSTCQMGLGISEVEMIALKLYHTPVVKTMTLLDVDNHFILSNCENEFKSLPAVLKWQNIFAISGICSVVLISPFVVMAIGMGL